MFGMERTLEKFAWHAYRIILVIVIQRWYFGMWYSVYTVLQRTAGIQEKTASWWRGGTIKVRMLFHWLLSGISLCQLRESPGSHCPWAVSIPSWASVVQANELCVACHRACVCVCVCVCAVYGQRCLSAQLNGVYEERLRVVHACTLQHVRGCIYRLLPAAFAPGLRVRPCNAVLKRTFSLHWSEFSLSFSYGVWEGSSRETDLHAFCL